MLPVSKNSLRRRLRPLCVAAFLQGFVFWYGIESTFLVTIGFDEATFGIMAALYALTVIAVETPSGILADRWSRKGVLILASLALAASSVLGGLSHEVVDYMVMALGWAVFYALYSGTYDSIVYDTLLEETGSAEGYERYYGWVTVIDSTALVMGSIAGGVIGHFFGLRQAYFLTVPFALLAIIALLRFREPRLHKAEESLPLRQHIATTLRAVMRQKALLPLVVVLVGIGVVNNMVFEFNRVWLIALAAPTIIMGPANAVALGGFGLGGAAASRLGLGRSKRLPLAMVTILIGLLGLIFSRSIPLTIASQGLLAVCWRR